MDATFQVRSAGRGRRPPVLARLVVLACLALAGTLARADSTAPFRVLVLTDFDQRSGPFVTVANSFSNELLRREDRHIVMRYIDLNARDPLAISAESAHRQLMEQIFAPAPPDLVLALGPPAAAFWQRNRGEAFADVPVLAAAAEVGGLDETFIAGQSAVISRFSFADQVGDIRQLLPRTRHIVLVYGTSPQERFLAGVAERQIRQAFPDLELELTHMLSHEELLERVRGLRDGSVVYHVTFENDAAGEVVLDDYSLAAVRAASSVPVFGPFENQLGQGVVGGRLIQLERVGLMLAERAQAILHGDTRPTGATWVDLSEPVYDWRELDAWGIAESRLPTGSEVRFRPPSLWGQYRSWIVALGLLVALQAWLTIQWWIERHRAMRAAATNAELSRRLINAHEDERRLIARELHDDLSQRLARLSIDASLIEHGGSGQPGGPSMEKLRDQLVCIGKDVHNLSYRLHPSLLEDLGLVNALRAECDDAQRNTEASILARLEDGCELPWPARINLFRIGQEALRNAVRHASSSRIEVNLRREAGDVVLCVTDDGCGFPANEPQVQFSLGIASMRERANLAGGALHIDSRPGGGTTVRVSVPATDQQP